MNFNGDNQKTVDVALLFYEATKGYSDLTRIIQNFSQHLRNYTPKKILSECSRIQNQRNTLSVLDEKILAIAKLASSEIQHETFVDDYRIAFNGAISAFDNLYTHLQMTKAELLSSQFQRTPN